MTVERSISPGAPGSGAGMLPGDVTWMMHYAPRPRLLYLVQPKVACSTVKLTLQNAELGRRQEGSMREIAERLHTPTPTVLRPAHEATELRRFVEDARASFCFVRNPYTRVLSAYLDKMRAPHLVAIFGPKLGISEEDLDKPVSFADFLERVARQAPEDMDVHWRPQTYLYDRLEPAVEFDFVGAFETFDADFAAFLCAVDPDLLDYVAVFDPHVTRAASRVDEYYEDAESVALAEAIYEEDFERFGYVMDPGRASEAPPIERWRNRPS